MQKDVAVPQNATETPGQNRQEASLLSQSSESSTRAQDSSEPSTLLKDLSADFKSLNTIQTAEMASALLETSKENESSQTLEVEIITRDGIIKRKSSNRPGDYSSNFKELKKTGISSSDFIGLDFSEKKFSSKGSKPAGLAVGLDAPPPDSLPEIEIITRDGNNAQQSDSDNLYKPKVSTWGVFERPANISQTVSNLLYLLGFPFTYLYIHVFHILYHRRLAIGLGIFWNTNEPPKERSKFLDEMVCSLCFIVIESNFEENQPS